MVKIVPELATKMFLATSDHEFLKLLRKFFTKPAIGLCEIHEVKAIGRWTDNNISRKDASFYKSEFRALIREETKEEYKSKLEERKQLWDPNFVQYWEENVEAIVDFVSMWKAKEIKWEGMTPLSIWSSNQSELYNQVLRYKLDYKEVQMDIAFHLFRDVQRAVLMESAR